MKIAIIAVVLVLALAAGGYLFYLNQGLKVEIANLKDEKAEVEKELAVLKSTDLAKEVEALNLKLKIAGRDISDRDKQIDVLEKDLAKTQNRLNAIEANLAKTKPYLDVVDLVYDAYWTYRFSEENLNRIEAKIRALEDSELSALWKEARRQTEPNNYNPSAVGEVISRLMSFIKNIVVK